MVSDNVKLDEEEFNIREFLQGTKNVIAIKAGKANLNIGLNISEKLPEKLISDQKKLTQILYNLVDNAIKYSKEGGHVIIAADLEENSATEIKLLLSVEDTGKGIAPDKIEQLLEADKLLLEKNPEEEPNKKRQLGLAIVTKLAKTMKGNLSIDSTLNERVGLYDQYPCEGSTASQAPPGQQASGAT